jgi:quinol monooxygenase YgiN
MIMVTGRFEIDPIKRGTFLDFARALVEQELLEPGCLDFAIYEDISTPNTFLMVEQWADADAMDAHSETDTFQFNDERLNSFMVGEPEFEEYEF